MADDATAYAFADLVVRKIAPPVLHAHRCYRAASRLRQATPIVDFNAAWLVRGTIGSVFARNIGGGGTKLHRVTHDVYSHVHDVLSAAMHPQTGAISPITRISYYAGRIVGLSARGHLSSTECAELSQLHSDFLANLRIAKLVADEVEVAPS